MPIGESVFIPIYLLIELPKVRIINSVLFPNSSYRLRVWPRGMEVKPISVLHDSVRQPRPTDKDGDGAHTTETPKTGASTTVLPNAERAETETHPNAVQAEQLPTKTPATAETEHGVEEEPPKHRP